MKLKGLMLVTIALALTACGDADSGVDADANNANGENIVTGRNSANSTNSTNSSNSTNSTNSTNATDGYQGSNSTNNSNSAFYEDPTEPQPDPHAGENYGELVENTFIDTATEATSTFSIDVDTGSYTLMRDDITSGRLPAPDGVRIEEYINYFDYNYPAPAADEIFGMQMEIAPSHFEDDIHLLRIGIKSGDVALADMKPANLVFLVDVSGSMDDPAKLPVVQDSLRTLVGRLRPIDKVAIVTYASREEIALPATEVTTANMQTIMDAIDTLAAGGGTNGEAGIKMAYDIANANKAADSINRVIMMTDGDLNVGLRGDALIDYCITQRDNQIALTTAGFGRGNYNDDVLEQLANNVNGNYVFIDSLDEAKRVFGAKLVSTLQVAAADVKIQVEFNPGSVVRYRLVGYENRLLDNEDFNDDTKDAGEIGPGHRVTAFYELELADMPTSSVLADLRVRYKEEFGDASILEETTLKTTSVTTFDDASDDFRFAAAVAEYAQILRESQYSTDARFDEVIQIANDTANSDPHRLEFVDLVTDAKDLWP